MGRENIDLQADNFLQFPISARGDLISEALSALDNKRQLLAFRSKYVNHLIAWTHHQLPGRKYRATERASQDIAFVLNISDQVIQLKWQKKLPYSIKRITQEMKECSVLQEAS